MGSTPDPGQPHSSLFLLLPKSAPIFLPPGNLPQFSMSECTRPFLSLAQSGCTRCCSWLCFCPVLVWNAGFLLAWDLWAGSSPAPWMGISSSACAWRLDGYLGLELCPIPPAPWRSSYLWACLNITLETSSPSLFCRKLCMKPGVWASGPGAKRAGGSPSHSPAAHQLLHCSFPLPCLHLVNSQLHGLSCRRSSHCPLFYGEASPFLRPTVLSIKSI